MKARQLTDIKISSLLDLDRDEMWRKVLRHVYGVSDDRTALKYSASTVELGMDFDSQLVAMLNLLPVSAIKTEAYEEAKSYATSLESELHSIMDDAPLKKALAIAREPFRQHSGVSPTIYDNIKGIYDMSELGRDYIGQVDRRVPIYSFEAATLENKRLVVANVDTAGLFVGPGISYFGETDAGATQKLAPGWVFFGPKVDLAPGLYSLTIENKCKDSSDELVFDVVANAGLTRLFEFRSVGSVSASFVVEVLEHHKMIEVRCVNPNNHAVLCDLHRVVFGLLRDGS